MTWPALPLFVRVAGRPVILLGDGEAAAAKRRLLERASALIVGETTEARLAIVAIDDEAIALAAVERLRARGVLINAVDRPDWCDFTLPAIVDRSPVLVAIGTGGVSAGLAAALRQRFETLLPASLGTLAEALHGARAALRKRFPDGGERRRVIGAMLAAGGALDPLHAHLAPDIATAIDLPPAARIDRIGLQSSDPDDLTLRQARWLADADRIFHGAGVPTAILDRARADAVRIACTTPPVEAPPGLSVWVEMT